MRHDAWIPCTHTWMSAVSTFLAFLNVDTTFYSAFKTTLNIKQKCSLKGVVIFRGVFTWLWPVARLIRTRTLWPSGFITNVGGWEFDPGKEWSVFAPDICDTDFHTGWQGFSQGTPVFPLPRSLLLLHRSIHLHFQKFQESYHCDYWRIYIMTVSVSSRVAIEH